MKRWWLLLALSFVTTACVTVRHPYVEPTGYGGYDFGTRIEDFDFSELELIGGDSLSLVDCDASIPLEVSDYFKVNEKSPYPSVVIDKVEYFFCYDGTSVVFCGVSIHYSSEEYEYAGSIDPQLDTNHRRFINALVKIHGLPHTGEVPRGDIVIETLEGPPESFLLRRSLKYERYSWCTPTDLHAPKDCKNAIVANFSPVMGEGDVFIATPRLRDFAAVYQRYTTIPYSMYETLYNAKPETAVKLPTRCRNKAAVGSEGPQPDAADVDIDTAMKNLLSEQILESAAADKHVIRVVREHGMSAKEFFDTLDKTRACRYGENSTGSQISYCLGIERGLSRRYFLGRYTTPQEDKKWREALTVPDLNIRQVGAGYRDGEQKILKIPDK